jgi:AraC family transcriptional regulator
MPELQLITVDFTREDDVLKVLRRPSLLSSENLGWNGIYVQKHQQPAWETPEYAHTKHMLLVHGVERSVRAERSFDGHRRQESLARGSNIAIVPAWIQHQVSWSQESDFTLLFLDPNFLIQVAYESVSGDRIELIPQFAMFDPFIDRVGKSLSAELESNGFGSRLFADSLTTALSVHLLRNYSNWQKALTKGAGGLPQRKLRQAIAYMHDHLSENLSLAAISGELDMSQYYFSRLFKQSMGVSPYQYVMRMRIEHAEYLLRATSLTVAAIAQQVGFANQNQLTIQFRKFTGTTPSNYRKQIRSDL